MQVGYAFFGRPIGFEIKCNGLFNKIGSKGLYPDNLELKEAQRLYRIKKEYEITASGHDKVSAISFTLFSFARSYGDEERPGGFIGCSIIVKTGFEYDGQKVLSVLNKMFEKFSVVLDSSNKKFQLSQPDDWNIPLPSVSKDLLGIKQNSTYEGCRSNERNKVIVKLLNNDSASFVFSVFPLIESLSSVSQVYLTEDKELYESFSSTARTIPYSYFYANPDQTKRLKESKHELDSLSDEIFRCKRDLANKKEEQVKVLGEIESLIKRKEKINKELNELISRLKDKSLSHESYAQKRGLSSNTKDGIIDDEFNKALRSSKSVEDFLGKFFNGSQFGELEKLYQNSNAHEFEIKTVLIPFFTFCFGVFIVLAFQWAFMIGDNKDQKSMKNTNLSPFQTSNQQEFEPESEERIIDISFDSFLTSDLSYAFLDGQSKYLEDGNHPLSDFDNEMFVKRKFTINDLFYGEFDDVQNRLDNLSGYYRKILGYGSFNIGNRFMKETPGHKDFGSWNVGEGLEFDFKSTIHENMWFTGRGFNTIQIEAIPCSLENFDKLFDNYCCSTPGETLPLYTETSQEYQNHFKWMLGVLNKGVNLDGNLKDKTLNIVYVKTQL